MVIVSLALLFALPGRQGAKMKGAFSRCSVRLSRWLRSAGLVLRHPVPECRRGSSLTAHLWLCHDSLSDQLVSPKPRRTDNNAPAGRAGQRRRQDRLIARIHFPSPGAPYLFAARLPRNTASGLGPMGASGDCPLLKQTCLLVV